MGTGQAAKDAGALLDAHRYADARDSYERLIKESEDPQLLTGLAAACRGMDDIPAAVRALERAHRLHVDAGDEGAAALAACTLADIQLTHFGASAVAAGWLSRASRHLRDLPDHAAHVPIEGQLAYITLAYDKDPVTARQHAERSLAQAVRLGDTSAELLAKGYLGMIEVTLGEVATGMALLDESSAAAAAGELSTTDALDTFCMLISACERVRDFARVEQWAQRVLSMATDTGGDGFATFARTQYATVLIWRGRWDDAAVELGRILMHIEEQPVTAAMAMVLRSTLLRRQGRLEEAEQQLAVAEREPHRRSVRHLVLVARAQLDLATGDNQSAADVAERYLRIVPTADRIERVDALDVLVRARVALGDAEAADGPAGELEETAVMLGTDGVLGTARLARGQVDAAGGNLEAARRHLEAAVEAFDAAGLPYELVEARLALAGALLADGQVEAAGREADLARREADALGVPHLLARTVRLLGGIRPGSGSGEFTGREVDVLRLMSDGRSNAQIAEELVLSVRTIERHVSNIYLKVGATGASARTSAVAHARRVGVL